MKRNFYSDSQYNTFLYQHLLGLGHVLLFGLPLCGGKNESLRN